MSPLRTLRALSAWSLIVAMGLGLSACGSTKSDVTLLAWPVLPDVASAPVQHWSPAEAAKPPIVVRRVQIPEYLQSSRVRYRESNEILGEWPAMRWAERLEVSLTRQLVSELNRLQAPGSACDTACVGTPATHSLQVDYLALDHLRSRQQIQARLRWTLAPLPGQKGTARQAELSLSEPVQGEGPAAQAAAMARLNARVAELIARSLTP